MRVATIEAETNQVAIHATAFLPVREAVNGPTDLRGFTIGVRRALLYGVHNRLDFLCQYHSTMSSFFGHCIFCQSILIAETCTVCHLSSCHRCQKPCSSSQCSLDHSYPPRRRTALGNRCPYRRSLKNFFFVSQFSLIQIMLIFFFAVQTHSLLRQNIVLSNTYQALFSGR